MGMEEHHLRVIVELVEAFDKSATNGLPEEIRDCIHEHGFLAVGAGFVPIPGASTVGAAANIWTMYARINSKVGITFSNNILKSIASGILANLGAYAIGLTIGEGLKFIPVVGSLLGAAIDAAILYSLTVTSAYIYIKALTAIARKNISSEAALSNEVNRILEEDKDEIKSVMKEAQKSYKKEHN